MHNHALPFRHGNEDTCRARDQAGHEDARCSGGGTGTKDARGSAGEAGTEDAGWARDEVLAKRLRRAPPVKSLGKGLRALQMLLAAESVGTNDVAAAIGVDKGAASRILRTLVACGFAVQGADRRYRALGRTGGRNASDALIPGGASIRERARPLLLQLNEVTGETAHLAIRADDRVLYLDKVDTELPLRVDRPVGTLAPLHCTALGKIFLAHQSAPLPCELTRFTARTAVDAAALEAQLRAIVADGYALDDEEFAAGIRCAAAPLRDARGQVVAAIGVSGPAARIAARELRPLGTLLSEIARDFPG